jgi:flagellin
MPSVINTNIPSLNTQRNLGTSQTALNTAIQRLSSGLRVNSAKDDAAGLAIAERMSSQVRGLNVAARNANDGVSLAQTAEGALGKIGEMVQRLRELAVQSSNATNSKDDRAALQAEVKELKAEISRVSTTSNFNGTKLLDGNFLGARFQVGADAGEHITINEITDARLSAMGGKMFAEVAVPGADLVDTGAIVSGDLSINGTAIGPLDAVTDLTARKAQLVRAINEAAITPLVEASYDPDADEIILTSLEDIAIVSGTAAPADGATQQELDDWSAAQAAIRARVGFDAGTTAAATVFIEDLDIGRYHRAQLAIQQVDVALTAINGARAQLGAVQSRFESAVSNIMIAAENATAARSRIMDTDFAAETAAMTRAQILQQAGNAMLAQANQLPQQVLTLLRNG